MSYVRVFALVLSILFASSTSQATVKIKGWFIAGDDCPALSSIKKKKNPGNIALKKGMAYKAVGMNKKKATHYLVKIEGAVPPQRWIPVSCGILLTDCKNSGDGVVDPDPIKPSSQEYVLAISWQPAFCQTHQTKPECESQTEDRFDADHFTLHGLWPQPRDNIYCCVSEQIKKLDEPETWLELPKLLICESTMNTLRKVMPGVQSGLQRHEWYKHGSCYDDPAEVYYLESMALLEQVNKSVVREFFVANIGKSVTCKDIRDKFDEAFGSGAGARVAIESDHGMVTELQLHLKGTIELNTPIGDLLKAADRANRRCTGGVIDPVGF
jgi:ribonuclease T2